MGYYMRGDYATGGYGYGRGDPGFLSSLWKGVKRIAAPIVGGLIGGPIGAVLAGGLGGKPTPPIMAPRAPVGPRYDTQVAIGPMRFRQTTGFPPVPQFGGAAMPSASAHERMAAASAGTGCCPRGYHLAKDGSGRCVRNRRMNVANPRALRRSMRRVQGFEKLARRTISFTRRVKMKK